MRKITTILFDLDGTLIDTNELIISSFLHTLNHFYPGDYDRESVLPFMGPPLQESFGKLNPEKCDDMCAHYREHNGRITMNSYGIRRGHGNDRNPS